MDEYTNVSKLLVIVFFAVFVGWRRLVKKRENAKSGVELEEERSEIVSELPRVSAEASQSNKTAFPIPWGIASAASEAAPEKALVVGKEGRYVKCERLLIKGSELIRTTEVDGLGRPCSSSCLHACSLDEQVRKLM